MIEIARDKLPQCVRCAYYSHSFVPGDGPLDAKMFVCGDSPWKTEEFTGLPFQGPAGGMLDLVLEEAGIDRSEIFVTNAVKCLPDRLGEPYPTGVVELCTKLFLQKELEVIRPDVIVLMGNNAVKAVVPKERGNISKVRGVERNIEVFGRQYRNINTFHPSYLLHNPSHGEYCVNDFKLAAGTLKQTNNEKKYRHVNTQTRFDLFWEVAQQSKIFSLDLETTSLDYREAQILSMNFSFAAHHAHVITFYIGEQENSQTLTPYVARKIYKLLHDSTKRIFFHNGKFDLRMLHYFFLRMLGYGIDVDKIRWYDSMACVGLLDENMRQSLKSVAPLYTDIRYTREELEDIKGGKAKKMSLQKLVTYSSKDADATRQIGMKFVKDMSEKGLWIGPFLGKDYSDMSVANVLFKMEVFGAPIDKMKMLEIRHMIERKLTNFHKSMEKEARRTFNPRSPDQLCDVLYKTMNYPDTGIMTKGGAQSTDKNVIALLMNDEPEDEFLIALHYYRQYDSIYKTFVKGLQLRLGEDGRLHPDFGFTNVVSGRIVCRNPNLANIPRDKEFEEGVLFSIREMFAARPGWVIVGGDSSQIEYKCAALLSGDKKMIDDIFLHRQDFHDMIARSAYSDYEKAEAWVKRVSQQQMTSSLEKRIAAVKIQLKDWRVDAKKFNFASIFGAEEETLARNLGVSVERVLEIIDGIEARYPNFWKWIRSIGDKALEAGELISAFARHRRFPPTPDTRVTEEQKRQAMNFGPQTNAAYCGRGSLVRIAKRCEQERLQGYPFNIVYDQTLVECPKEEEYICREIVAEEMLRPVPELDNRSFSIELGSGASWHAVEENAKKLFTMDDL